ncbi:hypothetical protein V1505DRAFT_357532 [Lipomyces doorenjongii]
MESTVISAWHRVDVIAIAIHKDNSLTSAIPRALRVDDPEGTTDQVGISNNGYRESRRTASTNAICSRKLNALAALPRV